MKSISQKRLVIDNNIWISFLIGKSFRALGPVLKANDLKILYCQELLEEIKASVRKGKLRRYFPQNHVELILEIFSLYGEEIQVKSVVRVCRDGKDNYLLNLCADGKADYR